MKTAIKLSIIALFVTLSGYAQESRLLQNMRPVSKDGLNVFEAPKSDTIEFDGEVKVRIGGDFAMQFQGLSQTNSGDSLSDLSSNFNLPTANLNIDVQLADGLRMHLRTYLSSKHHREAYVKGGYLQMDKLDFVKPGFLSGVMEFTTIRIGMDEINYGDAHFRRSDNARTLYNPFVGNYIMDAFTTEPFMEILVRKSGFIGMLGATNGRLNQSPLPGDDGMVLYGKLGYDKQINDDFRFRFTGSFYSSTDDGTRDYLYGGDRAGGRYYNIIDGGDFSGRFNPGWPYQTAFQFNPFIKWTGLELFGVLEFASNSDVEGSFNQIGVEALYRFGNEENLYVGGRYNAVSGEAADGFATQEINRLNIGGGWYMTKNVLTKIEYVSQKYEGAGYDGTLFEGAEFDGIVIEAAISF